MKFDVTHNMKNDFVSKMALFEIVDSMNTDIRELDLYKINIDPGIRARY